MAKWENSGMTTHEPRLTVRAIQPVAAGLEALGHDTQAILAAIGLDQTTLDNASGTVPQPP